MRFPEDACCQRVIGILFQPAHHSEDIRFIKAGFERKNLSDAEVAFRERAGFIHHDYIDFFGCFKRAPVTHQKPVFCAKRCGTRRDEQDCKAKRVGAGNHKDRYHSGKRSVHIAAHNKPDDKRGDSGKKRGVKEPSCNLVG